MTSSSPTILTTHHVLHLHLPPRLNPRLHLRPPHNLRLHNPAHQSGPIVGALLGSQSGREIAVEYAYEFMASADGAGNAVVDKKWFGTELRLREWL